MFSHHSEQMSQRSQVSWVALCMSPSKVLSDKVSEWVSDWLSQSVSQSVVDHPTQLVFIWIFICWVGGGDPCGVAELCISGLWSQKKQARTDVFLKYPCRVLKDSPEAENGTKNFIKPTKKPVCFTEFSVCPD